MRTPLDCTGRSVFEVTSVAMYLKRDFPASRVYRPTRWPALRLITCGGAFDARTRHYDGNTIAFASFLGSEPTR